MNIIDMILVGLLVAFTVAVALRAIFGERQG